MASRINISIPDDMAEKLNELRDEFTKHRSVSRICQRAIASAIHEIEDERRLRERASTIPVFKGSTRKEAIEWLREVIEIVGLGFHPDNEAEDYIYPLPKHVNRSLGKIDLILGDEVYDECLKIMDTAESCKLSFTK